MKKIKDLDVVKLTKDIPEKNLKKGTFGTVVFLFEIPCLAYEIEILDEKNNTTIITTLTPDQIELDNSRN
jgi:hypothetical protein